MSTIHHKQTGLALLFLLGALVTNAGTGKATSNNHVDVSEKGVTSQINRPTKALSDDFEAGQINRTLWWMGQAHDAQYWVASKRSRAARNSIAIHMNPKMRGCGASCQRNEIRTAPQHQINFGQEAWYSFRFRLDGELSTARWVSGQWKQQSNGSPFLAQRFDSGVFSITVQDGDCRVIVAKSEASRGKLPTTMATGKLSARKYPVGPSNRHCKSDIQVEYAENSILPNPYRNWVDMTYRVRGGRDGKGLVEIWANKRFIARVTGSIGDGQATGPRQYFKFGIYRKFCPGSSTAYLDDFRRASSMPKSRILQSQASRGPSPSNSAVPAG